MAQLAYVKVHGEAEKYLRDLGRLSACPRTVSGAKEIDELGRTFLRQIKMPYVPLVDLKAQAASEDGFSEYESRLKHVQDDLGIDVDDPETKDADINASIRARAVLGTLPAQQFCFSDALKVYLSDRAQSLAVMSPKKAKRFRLANERVVGFLSQALEEDKQLATIVRRDARAFRDYLVKRPLGAATVNKYMRMAATIWRVAAQEIELSTTNPFKGHSIADPTPEQEKRDPLTQKELSALLFRRKNMNGLLATVLTLLAYTGARTNEIAGLCIADVIIDDTGVGISHLSIRPNELRSLKSHSSRRTVPLLGEALKSAQDLLKQRTGAPDVALFERYGRDGGETAVSANLMKHLRATGITAKTKTIHSLRHTIKQALRDVGCPKDVSDAIQGHSSRQCVR